MSTVVPSATPPAKFVGEYVVSNDFMNETVDEQKRVLHELFEFIQQTPITPAYIDMVEYFIFNVMQCYESFDEIMKMMYLLILERVTTVNIHWVYSSTMLNKLGVIIQVDNNDMLLLALEIILNVLNTVHYMAKQIITTEFVKKLTQCITHSNPKIATIAAEIYALCTADSSHYMRTMMEFDRVCCNEYCNTYGNESNDSIDL